MTGRRRGFFVAEAAAAIVLLTILATALASLSWRHRQVTRAMEQTRIALRRAELAAAQLQRGLPAGEGVRVELLPGESGIEGRAWARIVAVEEGRRAELMALVPNGGGR